MSPIFVEILFILLLIMANGLFAMSELAVVSSRKVRLKQWADGGDRKAQAALDLAMDPNRFLSTVQVGITLVGTLAGVFGGATIAENLAGRLEQIPSLAPYGEAIGLTVVVVGIAYFSLVLGELVPKRLAMSRPERIASVVAGPLRFLSVIGVPVVRLLSLSTEAVLWVLGVRASSDPPITEEEVNVLLKEGAQAGIFELAEQQMVQRVFRFTDHTAGSLMTPRNEIIWIDPCDPPDEVRRKVAESPHSQFPVCEGTLDNVLGIVQAKDLLASGFFQQPYSIKGLLRVPLFIYEGTRGPKVLETFQQSGRHFAIVLSEYGSVEGLITTNDILEALVGYLPDEAELGDQRAVRREDGSWLVDGTLGIDEFRDVIDLAGAARLPEGDYHTIAGLVLDELGRIPSVADAFERDGLRFEVVDMDGRRIDKVLVSAVGKSSSSE